MPVVLLTIHNLLRWLALIAAVVALVRAYSGWLGNKTWERPDDRAGLAYTVLLDLQVLVGLALYFFPGTFTRIAFNDIGSAMQNAVVRFFAFEHVSLALLAVIVAHVGRAVSRRAAEPRMRFRRMALWLTASLVLLLAAIPWPFLANYGRPLLRFFGLF